MSYQINNVHDSTEEVNAAWGNGDTENVPEDFFVHYLKYMPTELPKRRFACALNSLESEPEYADGLNMTEDWMGLPDDVRVRFWKGDRMRESARAIDQCEAEKAARLWV